MLSLRSVGAMVPLVLLGCSPELNWRAEHVGELRTMMPCKPDRVTRPIFLSGQTIEMEMAGCEAAGALFAISRIQVEDADKAQALLSPLRTASLESMHATVVHAMPNSGDAGHSLDVRAEGIDPTGNAVRARLKWLLKGNVIFQVAVYGPREQIQVDENLFGEIRLP
jgi:hypothetical protein